MKHIGVVGVIVPCEVEVILAVVVIDDHVPHGLGHSHEYPSEEDRA